MKPLQATTKWFVVVCMLILTLCAFSGQASALGNAWANNQFNRVFLNFPPNGYTMLFPGQFMMTLNGIDFDANKNDIPSSVNGNYGYVLSMQTDGNLVVYGGSYWSTPLWATNTFGHNAAILSPHGDFYIMDIDTYDVKWGIGPFPTAVAADEFYLHWSGAAVVEGYVTGGPGGGVYHWDYFNQMIFPHSGCHDAACQQAAQQWGSEATVHLENYCFHGASYDYANGVSITECINHCVQDRANRCIGYLFCHTCNPTVCYFMNGLPGTGETDSWWDSGYIKGRCGPGQSGNCRTY